jgi:hypothetical protein
VTGQNPVSLGDAYAVRDRKSVHFDEIPKARADNTAAAETARHPVYLQRS